MLDRLKRLHIKFKRRALVFVEGFVLEFEELGLEVGDSLEELGGGDWGWGVVVEERERDEDG